MTYIEIYFKNERIQAMLQKDLHFLIDRLHKYLVAIRGQLEAVAFKCDEVHKMCIALGADA